MKVNWPFMNASLRFSGNHMVTTEFYKTFWPIVVKRLVETLSSRVFTEKLFTSEKKKTETITKGIARYHLN